MSFYGKSSVCLPIITPVRYTHSIILHQNQIYMKYKNISGTRHTGTHNTYPTAVLSNPLVKSTIHARKCTMRTHSTNENLNQHVNTASTFVYSPPAHTTNREEASSKQYQEVCVTWVNRQESKHVQTGGPHQYSTDKEGGSKYIPELSSAIIRCLYFKNACAYLGYNRVWLCLVLNRDLTKMLQRNYIDLPVDKVFFDKEYVNFAVWIYLKQKLAFWENLQKWSVRISGNYSRVHNLSLSVHLRKNRVNISVRKPTSKMSEVATKSDSGGSGEYYWNVHVIIFTLSTDISVHCYSVLCCTAIINVVNVGYKKFYLIKSICYLMPNASISIPYSVYCKHFLRMTSISKCSLHYGE